MKLLSISPPLGIHFPLLIHAGESGTMPHVLALGDWHFQAVVVISFESGEGW